MQFFRYCTVKLLEGFGGFRRGPKVHKQVHHDPRASMGCGEAKKEGVLVGIGLDLESKSSPP